jgi:cell division septation protein DedD
MPKAKAVPKALIRTKLPTVKKEISKQTLEVKPQSLAKQPKDQASPPAPQSRPAAKVMVVRQSPEGQLGNEIVSYPYSLLLYHFRSLERAKDVVSFSNKKGLSAYWVKVELSNGVWHRVFVGHFQNREEADRFRRDNGLKDATVKETRYANLIGVYPSSHGLEDKILALKNLGYSTYVIKEQDGRSRLFVGTFITKEGAETQRQDLASNGIQSQAVER